MIKNEIKMVVRIQCRKCRCVLVQSCMRLKDYRSCLDVHVHFKAENAPDFLKPRLTKLLVLKGKINCHQCGSKLGAFDFTASPSCNDIPEQPSLYYILSKIDMSSNEQPQSSSSCSKVAPQQPAVVQPCSSKDTTTTCAPPDEATTKSDDSEGSADTEKPHAAAGVESAALFQNEALEMGRKKLSEVAFSITHKGRECVANICASVDANITAHLPEFATASASTVAAAADTPTHRRKRLSKRRRRRTRSGTASATTSDDGDDTDDVTEASSSSSTSLLRPISSAALSLSDALLHGANGGGDTNDLADLAHDDDNNSCASTPVLGRKDVMTSDSQKTKPAKKKAREAGASVTTDSRTAPEAGSTGASDVNADLFTCSVCLEIYYLPQRCDPCEHVFCDPCLRQVNGSATAGSDVKCPLCRKVIKKCSTYDELWTATKNLFPSEYQERHKLERRKRRHRASLPGTNSSRARLNRRHNRQQGGGFGGLKMLSAVCFVILFMMAGFTVFATTVGFVAWYLLEVAMDLLVDVTLEIQTFSELLKTCLILFCIDGRLSPEKWQSLYDSAGRVVGAFSKLVKSRNNSLYHATVFPGNTEADSASFPGAGAAEQTTMSSAPTHNDYSYQTVWKITQQYIANYVVFGCLVTFVLYKFAKYMQARRA